MPKQILKLEQFHGGLSTNSDPRDVADNELTAATDVMVDELGKIRTLGGTTNHDAGSSTTVDIEAGYGLFQFSHDRINGHLGEHLDERDFATHANWDRSGDVTDSGVGSVTTLTPTPSAAWEASQTHASFIQTWSSSSGVSMYVTATTDGSGNPTFVIDRAGHLFAKDETVVFTDPGSSVNTATLTVDSLCLSFSYALDTGTGSTTSSIGGTALQVYGDRLEAGIGGITYAFTYTVTVTTAPDGDFALTLDNFPASSTTLPFTAGTHTVTFTSHANAATSSFTITATETTSTEGEFTIDNVSLVIYDAAETGDDYLLLADDESSDPAVYIYSKNNDLWSESQTITIGDTNSFAPCFYTVDGAVRISDGNFGSTNSNKWYGYINRELFSEMYPSYAINQWYSAPQKISAPNASTWDDNTSIVSAYGDSHNITGGGYGDYDHDIDRTVLSGQGLANVIRAEISFKYRTTTPGARVEMEFEVGTYHGGAFVNSEIYTFSRTGEFSGTFIDSFIVYPDAINTDTTLGSWTDFRVIINSETGTESYGILDLTCYELGGLPDHSSRLTNNNVHIDFDWATTTGASGWNNADNTGEWKVGVSFIYDGIQESQITTLSDAADSSVTSFTVPGSLGVTAAPSIRLFIADFQTVSSEWNKRITGCNVYMQDMSQDLTQPWFLQLSADFDNGKLKVASSQKDYNASYYYEASQEYYYWEIGDGATDGSVMLAPANIITYEINSGLLDNEKSILSKYKTAVAVGRIVYIGGLEIQNEDGSTEVKGDAMIKSPVNKFDLFPLSRLIEVSVQDGDSIVKLEEYADRILQFKKNKMHLINVSQELEFLEDTFVHKGVSHPAATCKTDFGVAWVNKFGCYLYDGQKVTNLLEKGGRQIIKESDWTTFTANEPMIGYIPQKRQLLLVDDNTSTGTGNIFLYDLVTQSWIEGSDATMTSDNLTNFVTDWNGDLVHAHTNGTILKWRSASTASSAVSIITKDIDFGQPGIRKKIYKVYITYKGTSDTNIDVFFDVDGGTALNKTFQNGTNFSSNQLTASSTWAVAELKPTTSSEANNKKSFRLKFVSNGASASDFSINDISIVYRLKNIK